MPFQSLSWQELTLAHARSDLCKVLASQGFAILELPQNLSDAVIKMRLLAAEFFDRPREERCAMGRLRLYRDKVVGYRELAGGATRFLEVHALAGGGLIPAPKVPKGLGLAAVELHTGLQDMAIEIISWLAEDVGIPPQALLQCLDASGLSNLEDGDCSASVLRLCSYGFESTIDNQDLIWSEGAVSFFDEHTDASFLTLAPVGSTPGLQFRNRFDNSWYEVEHGLDPNGAFLIVFIGDFLEVLTKGTYTAAAHRVASQDALDRRLSMPFLVRGQPAVLLNTCQYLDEDSMDAIPLLRLEDIPYSDLRTFLDLKGRKRFRKDINEALPNSII